MGGSPTGPERAQLGLLAALAAAVPVSIFAAEVLLGLSVLVLALRLARGGARIGRTRVDTPLLAFTVWTLLAASFAEDPVRSHEDAKKLVLFTLFYLAVEVLAREGDRERVLSSVLLGGLALAGLMVLQRHFLGMDRLGQRPPGFLGHYMSAAGVTMVVLLLAFARLVLGPPTRPRARDSVLPLLVLAGVAVVAAASTTAHARTVTRAFVLLLVAAAASLALSRRAAASSARAALPWVVLPLAAWALVVSQTRNAWVGVVVGVAVIAARRSPRLVWVVAGATAALLVLRPARLTIDDASTRDRYYMWQAGIDMVLDRPVFGQGPGMILLAYPRYRWPEATHPQQPHLHNNVLEIAAERGLPGLVFFLWWAVVVFAAALAETRRAATGSAPAAAAGAALATLSAVFVAGLFEYNLGDSEVLMVALLLIAVPFALERTRPAAA